VQALWGALMRQACVAGYGVGSLDVVRGAAGAAAWLPGTGTGVMPLKAASALNSLRFGGDPV
jgi:hypothetical protein